MFTTVCISGSTSTWLLKALGWQRLPSTVAVIQEIHDEIQNVRGKRCNGLWKGKVCTPTLKITVRAHEVHVMNVLHPLELIIDDNHLSLTWFVQELYSDLKRASQNSLGEVGKNEPSGYQAADDADKDEVSGTEQGDDGKSESPEDLDRSKEDEEAMWAQIKSLKQSDGRVKWAASKHAYLVKEKGKTTPKVFSISKKLMEQRPLSAYLEGLRTAKDDALEFSRGCA